MESNLELKLEKILDVPRELVWRCWTEPKNLMPWFCPKPWQVVDARIDLRVGGEFFNLMQSPEGEKFPNDGIYLDIVKASRLVWTNAYKPGWLPNPAARPMLVTIHLEFADAGAGKTKYTARAMHWDEAARKKHEEMGFHDGWKIATEQLVQHAKTLA
jgi:uncharacterized protein YndB with AHSA1/START domain